MSPHAPLLPELCLPLDSDLLDPLHSSDSLLHHVAVISLRPVPPSFHLKSCVLHIVTMHMSFSGHQGRFRQCYEGKTCESLTAAKSLPCSLLYALVHLTLRGFLFSLKFLWHFDRQKRKTCRKRGGINSTHISTCKRKLVRASLIARPTLASFLTKQMP